MGTHRYQGGQHELSEGIVKDTRKGYPYVSAFCRGTPCGCPLLERPPSLP
jgi:hypothetical protein